ncbi:MAG: AAA family ATPase, partial [Akkermansiaceae bacterium]
MHIEQLSLKNFRAFRDVEMRNIPRFAIIIGANGSGKSTLFTVFAFLREAMATNVNTALSKLGGSNGFSEVRSRDSTGPIEIEVKFRESNSSPLVTYSISIDQDPKSRRAYVAKEILQYRRGSKGQ